MNNRNQKNDYLSKSVAEFVRDKKQIVPFLLFIFLFAKIIPNINPVRMKIEPIIKLEIDLF